MNTLRCALALAFVLTGCNASDLAKLDTSSASPEKASVGGDGKSGAAADGKKPAEEPTVELDLTPVDKSLAGWVMTAPKSAKIDGTRIAFGEEGDGFLELMISPGWEDSVKGLSNDKDNSNIKKVSDTEYRWERNPPIGRMFLVDILFKVGNVKWSCTTGMMGPLKVETADTVSKMCKSITKKK